MNGKIGTKYRLETVLTQPLGLGVRPCTGLGLWTFQVFSIRANDILKVMALNLVISTPQ